MAQKGGRKLSRSSKKKGYYTAQFHRTEANKARRKARIARRKKRYPEGEN